MSGLEIIFWLVVFALLAYYAWIKHRHRLRVPPKPCDPAQWTGKGIDVSRIIPKVEVVRRDHLAVRQPPKGLCFHRALVELARKAVADFAYFHDREPQDHFPVRRA
jgi:hypothetical protein